MSKRTRVTMRTSGSEDQPGQATMGNKQHQSTTTNHKTNKKANNKQQQQQQHLAKHNNQRQGQVKPATNNNVVQSCECSGRLLLWVQQQAPTRGVLSAAAPQDIVLKKFSQSAATVQFRTNGHLCSGSVRLLPGCCLPECPELSTLLQGLHTTSPL